MENSAKAILMAGGLLLALLTLALLTVMFRNVQTIAQADENKKEVQKIQEWNAEWEAYNKKIMYGTDVLTVVNKAEKINDEFPGQPIYHVTINIEGININELVDHKLSIFECTKIEYSEKTGKVNKMTFKFVK